MKLRIKELRVERGWTQKHLAELADMSVPFLSQIENGKRTAGMKSMQEIATALRVSVSDLFADQSDNEEKRLLDAVKGLSEDDLTRIIQFAENLALSQQQK